MDPKRWADHRKLDLDLDMKLAGFVAWRDRALRLLGSRTPARTQVVAVGGISEPPHQLRDLRVTQHDHVRFTVEPRTSVRGRSRARVGLWRKLHAEWRGSAPQVIPAKAMKYQDPNAAVGSTAILGAIWEGMSHLRGSSTEARQAGASRATDGYRKQARACRLLAETVVGGERRKRRG